MKYEVIVENFARFEGGELCIRHFNAKSDAEAILKVAAYHGMPALLKKPVEEVSVKEAEDILHSSFDCDDSAIVYQIKNLETGVVLVEDVDFDEDASEEYDEAFEEYINAEE